jgi:cytochrome P450
MFERPYEFDPDRSPNSHIGFGNGPHYCIGAPLSRLALTMLLEELAANVEEIQPTGPLTHLYSNWVNGIVSMPVLAKPRRSPCG